ncbi:MAG: NINE protein [Clostridia bacterium]|nr:NINE protein [Clostridia bacterium]
MEKTNKKGGTGLLITSIIALVMLVLGSFLSFRGVGAIPLYAEENRVPVFFSLYRFLLGFLFVAGTFLIGKKSDKKGIAIIFSIVNMLIAFAAFMPVRRYFIPMRSVVFMLTSGRGGAGLIAILPFVFYALIILFALLTMLAALKKDRKQPKGLCILILITLGVYALLSIVSLMFENPFYGYRLRFRGISYISHWFRLISMGRITFMTLINPFSNTAHILFPFATIPVLLAMFFAAKSIKPIEAAVPAEAAPVYEQACEQPYSAAPAYEQPYAAPVYEQKQTRYSGKSKAAAAVLAGTLGQFGVHRYYLGYIGSGVVQSIGGMLYIIGYTLLISAELSYNPPIGMLVAGIIMLLASLGTSIWALVDFIRILCNSLKPAGGEFGNAPQASAIQQDVYSAPQPDYFTPQPDYSAPQQPVYTAPVEEYTAPQETTSPAPANEANAQDENLRKLDDMLAKGLISMEEYIDIRRRRLNGQ